MAVSVCPDYGNVICKISSITRMQGRSKEKKKINNSKIAKLHMVPVNFEELQGRGTLLRCKDDFFF